MDKVHPSRWQRRPQNWLMAGLVSLVFADTAAGLALSQTEALRIGRKIWQNECNGTIAGLTSWNNGEKFASLGIGHFIWYPPGERGPFDESFPKFVAFAKERGAKLPSLLRDPGPARCPWPSRTAFLQAQQSTDMRELRQFLASTIDLQSQFLVERLQVALPKMLAESEPTERDKVREHFSQLAGTASGCYALVDYVNFKGEGVLHSERYQGQGWGLLQVLTEMPSSTHDPLQAFSRAAATVLTRRVHNSPAERKESQWLQGWLRRVNSYSRD